MVLVLDVAEQSNEEDDGEQTGHLEKAAKGSSSRQAEKEDCKEEGAGRADRTPGDKTPQMTKMRSANTTTFLLCREPLGTETDDV